MVDVEKLTQKVEEFPTLPTIYSALSEVMANPRSTIQDAVNIISQDQASASKILKAANSSIYGIRVNIDTITQAIFYIGFDEVKNLILALSIIDIFNKAGSKDILNPVGLWKHSIAVGAITRSLGKALSIHQLENYFVAGILHDIGKLFFYRYMPDEYIRVIEYSQENSISLREAEKTVIGVTDTIAGELLAQKWRLPRNIVNAISYHYSGLVDGKVDTLTSCVHLAEIISSILELGDSGNDIIPEPNIKIWEELNFDKKIFTKSMQQIIHDFDESVSLLLNI